MTCPRCGLMIAGLACPACLALQSREAIYKMQGSYLGPVRAGRMPFLAKRLSIKHPWHLMLFGDRAHGWCGIEIQAVGPNNRSEIPYKKLADWVKHWEKDCGFCPKCIAALAQIEEREAIREES